MAKMASDDCTWERIAQMRFCISTKRTKPRNHGGRTWKDAYRSMAYARRIPRCRFTSSRKTIFAKGASRQYQGCGDCVSLWVMIGHTENCETRRATPRHHRTTEEQRFIELNVCIQNVRSSFGSVTVHVLDAALQAIQGTETTIASPVCSGWMQPRLLCFHRCTGAAAVGQSMIYSDSLDLTDGIRLHPFDFCVVSMHFPCSHDVFETDFLARALQLRVPVFPHPSSPETITKASAYFLPEKEIWNYYTELPGGFLSLNDKFRLLAA